MVARVVIGSSFGDEGKGLVTDYLCSHGAGIVVRFNGGAQAGHTVIAPNGDRHVFHHFGSGTFLGVPTFLSQFFVLNPITFFMELKELAALGYKPDVYAHPECIVTTYADMLINQTREEKRGAKRHGSCGLGIHETIIRSGVKELKITMADLWNGGRRLRDQLKEITTKYAEFRCGKQFTDERTIEHFVECAKAFADMVNPLGIDQCKDPVFEGAQGLLLDMDNKRFFPHVTHSKTGMHNVEVLCQQAGIDKKEIYYVSRTYLTRHGAGELPGEDPALSYHDDTNQPNKFQGTLRFAPLDGAGLRQRIAEDAGANQHKLVLTHCDQLAPDFDADLYSYGPCRTSLFNSQLMNAG